MGNTKLIMGICAFIFASGVGAQTQYDVARLMGSELNGTARFVGMGGAMGALGGDISVMGTNPAGIGIYRSNDLSVSFGFNSTITESDFVGHKAKEDRTRMSFDQIGFVYSNKIGNTTSLRYVNFGFNYHKNKNFNRLFTSGGILSDNMSQTWQMADILGDAFENLGVPNTEIRKIWDSKNPYEMSLNYPFIGILGARTDLIGLNEEGLLEAWNGYTNKYTSREEGGINQYDFNIAFNIEDRIYLGLTLGAYDVNYKKYSYYTEDIDRVNGDNGFYELENWFETKGSGINLKFGVIARPFEESPFRIGFAVHTPTWYDLTDYTSAYLYSELDMLSIDKVVKAEEFTPDYLGGDTQTDYKLITPWKFNVNMGTTLGGLVAVGAEYEYENYSSAKLEYDDGMEMIDRTKDIKDGLKGVHTLRLGMETRVTPEFSVRAGYNYTTAAFEKSTFKYLYWNDVRTDTDFNNSKERNTFTFGLGYRSSIIYADLAYKYDMYKSNFYAFDDSRLQATKVDNLRHQLLFTIGARF